jgi:hypothetical protein
MSFWQIEIIKDVFFPLSSVLIITFSFVLNNYEECKERREKEEKRKYE